MSFYRLSGLGYGRFWRNSIIALLLLGLALLFGAGTVGSSSLVIPTISITSVNIDDTVTIQTHHYPAGQTFTVRMGKIGTQGIGGIVVATIDSGTGGSFPATFKIPDALKGDGQIAIRLDSNRGYYSYNWFFNAVGSPPPVVGPVYTGIPTFMITAVKAGESVTIQTNNFPAGMTFAVTMGKMYTRGIGGIYVGDLNSGAGGTLTATFNIPEALKNDARISIRAQTAHANPYYAFNWFYNASTNGDGSDPGDGTTIPVPVYTGIPTFTVCTVTRDGSVTILTKNFPTNQTFAVTMGPMYTQGIGGIQVGTLASEANSSGRYTFNVPDGLKGSYRISIRAQTGHAYPYYAYNWFYNNSTTRDHCQ